MDIGRLQPIFIMAAAAAGVAIGALTDVGGSATALIEPFLMALLFVLFLSVDARALGRSFRNVRFTASALFLNFVLTPVVAYVLGAVFFSGSVDLRIGLMMLLVTPCTDWYLVFTGMTKGNVELGASILPLNLILQIVLLPVYLLVFMGSDVSFDVPSMLADMCFVLAVPLALAIAVRLAFSRREGFSRAVSEHGDNAQLLFLCIAVVAMFASEGGEMVENPVLLVELFVPLAIFFAMLFLLSQSLGRAIGAPYRDRVALTFTSMARNSPLSLAIAVAVFPDQPLISLALVIGPLIEIPVLSLASWILLRKAPEDDAEPAGA